MKKSDLKQLIKPLVKECIHDVLLDEGLLSNIVSEVAKGMQGDLVVETRTTTDHNHQNIREQKAANNEQKLANRKKLMDAIGSEAYNGVNLFEGTEAMTAHEAAAPKAGSIDLGDPRDSGVDISSLVGGASRMWSAMK